MSVSYDNQFDDEDEEGDSDTQYNDVLNDMILSVESNTKLLLADTTHKSRQDSFADSAAANELFDKIFTKYRSNVKMPNINTQPFGAVGGIACAAPLTPTQVSAKRTIPNQIEDSPPNAIFPCLPTPPPPQQNLNMKTKKRRSNPRHSNRSRTTADITTRNRVHNINNENNTNHTLPLYSQTPQLSSHNPYANSKHLPPMYQLQQSVPMKPQRHRTNDPMSPVAMMKLSKSNNKSISMPASPHFPHVRVISPPPMTSPRQFNRHRSFDPHFQGHDQLRDHALTMHHSAPINANNYRHSTSHVVDVSSPRNARNYYPQNQQPYGWAQNVPPVPPPHHMNYNNNNNNHHRQWSQTPKVNPMQHHVVPPPLPHSKSVCYGNNTSNDNNTVHITYNININNDAVPPPHVPIATRSRSSGVVHSKISPQLLQSTSQHSSLEDLIAKQSISAHRDESDEMGFIPPSPRMATVASNQSHAPTIVEGPGAATTTTSLSNKHHSSVRNYRCRNHDSSVSHDTKDTASILGIVNGENQDEDDTKELSTNSVFGDSTSDEYDWDGDDWDAEEEEEDYDDEEEESDENSCSSSDSWRAQQKKYALNTESNIVCSMPQNRNRMNTTGTYQSSGDHQYVIDALFNIKKFSQTTEAAVISPEEFEASYVFQKIPQTLNEEEEDVITKRTTTTTRSSTVTSKRTTTTTSSNISDPNTLQLKEIIWSVTNPQNTGADGIKIRDVLLLCHPIFIESTDLLSLLKKRFLSLDSAEDESMQWQIQSKVTVFLQHWMKHYYYQDFELSKDNRMHRMMCAMIEAMRQHFGDNVKGKVLPNSVERTMKSESEKLKRNGLDLKSRTRNKAMAVLGGAIEEEEEEEQQPNEKEKQKNDKAFLACDNKKIAQQLTLMAYEQFCKIEPRECLCQNWKKKDKELRAPNILNNVEFFNNLSSWISMTILNIENVKQRGRVIKKWIKIGAQLFELHNFESLAAVQGTLTSTPIYRLKREWKYVQDKHRHKFKEFKVIYARAKNNANLRKIIQITPPPMIPYTGIFLQDLFVIEESRNTQQNDGTINFPKLMALHREIKRIQVLQNTKYDAIQPIKPIQQIIREGLNRYKHLNSQDIYDISMRVSKLLKKKK